MSGFNKGDVNEVVRELSETHIRGADLDKVIFDKEIGKNGLPREWWKRSTGSTVNVRFNGDR